MKIFFIPLLLLMISVKGQELRLTMPKYDSIRINIPLKEYDELRKQNSVSINALRHLNDSLQKKLQLLVEFQDYACPVLENLDLIYRKQRNYIRFVDRDDLVKALKGFRERYKKN